MPLEHSMHGENEDSHPDDIPHHSSNHSEEYQHEAQPNNSDSAISNDEETLSTDANKQLASVEQQEAQATPAEIEHSEAELPSPAPEEQAPEIEKEPFTPEEQAPEIEKEPFTPEGENRPALKPPSHPLVEKVITPRQEQAVQYLERKLIRNERITAPIAAIKANGNSKKEELEKEDTILFPIAIPKPEEAITPSGQKQQSERFPDIPPPGMFAPRHRNGMVRSLSIPAVQRRRKLLRHLSRKHMREIRDTEQRSFKRFWITALSLVAVVAILFLAITGAGSYITYRVYNDTQSRYNIQVSTLRDLIPPDNLKMYDSKGIIIGQLADQGLHTYVPLEQISPDLIKITVSTEDKDFWTNPGVDILRILEAAVQNLKRGEVVSGGSTITQQLIKNLIVGDKQNTTHQFDNSNIIRKLEEIMLTPEINSHYSKNSIMEMYLNSIYYGEQAYGIDAAAHIYFGLNDQPNKPASAQLDLAQAAMLAGMPSSPYLYDPLVYHDTAFQRFQTVLDLGVRNGVINRVQAQDALSEAQKPGFFKQRSNLNNRAPHFFNFALRQVEQQFHLTRQELSRSGMSVYTTLDIALQDKIQKIAQDHIASLSPDQHLTNAAEVLIDFHTGAIRTLLGSIDYSNDAIDGNFDVATQGLRQPGSSFKPYVYATAFKQGYSPGQAVDDSPLSVYQPGAPDPFYTPQNYDQKFHGHMTIRCALQNSLNIPAVKALQYVGINNALQTAKDMGLEHMGPEQAGLSLVLGGKGVSLLEHTSAYGTFANGGVHVPYYTIDKIVFSGHRQSYVHRAEPGKQAISPQIAYMITNILSDNQSRIPDFYDCNVLQLYSNSQNGCYAGDRGVIRPAAAKTGTTNNFKDNWTMGYTTDYVMGVWAGNDDGSPMGEGVTGVLGAAPIWHDSMLTAEEGHPIRDFQNPGGLVRTEVTYPDGVRTTDWYLPDHIPTFKPYEPQATTPAVAEPLQPEQSVPLPPEQATAPYCPNDFSFVGPQPKANNAVDPNRGWW